MLAIEVMKQSDEVTSEVIWQPASRVPGIMDKVEPSAASRGFPGSPSEQQPSVDRKTKPPEL